MKKRFLSILLAICMVLTALPFPALAADGFTDDGTEIIPTICDTQGHDWSRHDGICAREDCDAQCVHEKWADGICVTCGFPCPHTERIDDGPDGCLHYYSCAVCDYRYTVPCHDWSGPNGVCPGGLRCCVRPRNMDERCVRHLRNALRPQRQHQLPPLHQTHALLRVRNSPRSHRYP